MISASDTLSSLVKFISHFKPLNPEEDPLADSLLKDAIKILLNCIVLSPCSLNKILNTEQMYLVSLISPSFELGLIIKANEILEDNDDLETNLLSLELLNSLLQKDEALHFQKQYRDALCFICRRLEQAIIDHSQFTYELLIQFSLFLNRYDSNQLQSFTPLMSISNFLKSLADHIQHKQFFL